MQHKLTTIVYLNGLFHHFEGLEDAHELDVRSVWRFGLFSFTLGGNAFTNGKKEHPLLPSMLY